MTQVVDGVRRGSLDGDTQQLPLAVRVLPRSTQIIDLSTVELERPRPIKRSVVAARLPQGRLDGVRKQMAPRVIPKQPAPAKPAQHLATQPVPAITPATQRWISQIRRVLGVHAWRRPAAGLAMFALAFVAAGVMVKLQSTPADSSARAGQNTAQALATATAMPAVTASPTPNNAGLQQILNAFAAKNPGMFSLYVKNLKTGEVASVQAGQVMTSASLYKLFVAQRILAQVDLGQLQLMVPAGGGTSRSIESCLNIMITVSDNGCGRALGDKLGWGAQNQALAVEGYQGTDLSTPQQTTAQDVATLLERLYLGTHLSPRSNEQFLQLLKSQRVNNRLPQGLPAGTVLAHKTGDLNGYVHDAGVVYGPKADYLVVVMSGPWKLPGTAASQFGALSGQLWHYFEN